MPTDHQPPQLEQARLRLCHRCLLMVPSPQTVADDQGRRTCLWCHRWASELPAPTTPGRT